MSRSAIRWAAPSTSSTTSVSSASVNRPVDARRRDLERVRAVAHHVAVVQLPAKAGRQPGDVVQPHAAVLVDQDAEDRTTSGADDLDTLEVQPRALGGGPDHGEDLRSSRLRCHRASLAVVL
jgi:hypothetical protein